MYLLCIFCFGLRILLFTTLQYGRSLTRVCWSREQTIICSSQYLIVAETLVYLSSRIIDNITVEGHSDEYCM